MHSTKILIISLLVLVAQQFVSPLVMASMEQQFSVKPTLESDNRISPSKADKFLAKESNDHRHGIAPSISKDVALNSDNFSAENFDSASPGLQMQHLQHASANMMDCCDSSCICCGGDCQPIVAIHSRRLPDSFDVVSFIPDSASFPADSSHSLYRPPISR